MNKNKNSYVNAKLKQLRIEKGITQEELAEYLNVTYQAVSRWERGEGYPDITYLPEIAHFYGVSIDYLFGINEENDRAKVQKYIERSTAFRNASNTEDDLQLWQKAFHEFPSDFIVITNLVEAMYFADYKMYETEIAEYGNKVLQHCRDYALHYRVIRRMCLMYINTGKKDIVYDYIRQLPGYEMTRGQFSLYLLDGEDLIRQIQMNLYKMLDAMMINMRMIPEIFYNENPDLKMKIIKKLHDICDTFFECSDFGSLNRYICWIYCSEAAEYMKCKDKSRVLSILEKVLPFALESDTPTHYQHRSMLFNRIYYDSSKVMQFDKNNQSKYILNVLKSKLFDPIRNEPKFVKIYACLAEHAGKN